MGVLQLLHTSKNHVSDNIDYSSVFLLSYMSILLGQGGKHILLSSVCCLLYGYMAITYVTGSAKPNIMVHFLKFFIIVST